MKHRVHIHIAVPKVALSYNNHPPALFHLINGCGKDKIRRVLDDIVVSKFESLWVCLDEFDAAPDGGRSRDYVAKMVDYLVDAVKDFLDTYHVEDDSDAALNGLIQKVENSKRINSQSSKVQARHLC